MTSGLKRQDPETVWLCGVEGGWGGWKGVLHRIICSFAEYAVCADNRAKVISADVMGKIKLKTKLSGMPECKLGMNDKACFLF